MFLGLFESVGSPKCVARTGQHTVARGCTWARYTTEGGLNDKADLTLILRLKKNYERLLGRPARETRSGGALGLAKALKTLTNLIARHAGQQGVEKA